MVISVEFVDHSDLLVVVVDHEISAWGGHRIEEIEAAERRSVCHDRDQVGASSAVRSAVLVDGVNSIVETEQIGVVAAAAKECVVAGPADQQVVTTAAVERIIAGTGKDQIVSAAGAQGIIAAGPRDDVVTARRAKDVVGTSSQRVAAVDS